MLGSSRGSKNPREAFFTGLPADRLTDQEEELLQAIQHLSSLISALLPRCVSVQDWAEQRIPPELAASVNDSGAVFIRPDGAFEAEERAASSKPAKRRRASESENRGLANQAPTFLVEEMHLREAILQFAHRGRGPRDVNGRGVVTIAKLERMSIVMKAFDAVQNALRRKYLSLSDWVKERGFDWFDTTSNHEGAPCVSTKQLTEEQKQERLASREKLNAEYFENLPKNTFTPEEDTLRNAILDFLDDWKADKPLMFQTLCDSPAVKEARTECLPPGVSMVQWCELRIGGEVQCEKKNNGNVFVRKLA